jgi:valyl-tRNA synthetase
MNNLPKNYDFAAIEEKWQKFWQEQQVYAWDQDEERENSFIVDTPPPTVSGQLHIGHVYSYTHTDFIVRFQRMRGKNISYPIGFDDNGLPTERLVEKQKDVKASLMDRQEFVKICKEVVASEEEKFRIFFNRLALSVDWNLEYQTIDPLSQKLSQMSFLDLVQKGEVYRDNQPMLWDPVDQTALAQADIEDKEKDSLMNDILFECDNGEKLIIATTRPELLPACVAVFYNPNDPRYQYLQGLYAITPLFGHKVPIIADELVQIEKGTGLVMCCTFGDATDISWWKKYKLPLRIIIDKKGKIANLTFENYFRSPKATNFANLIHGLKVKEARNKILQILQEENLLVKQSKITHTVKCAERSGAPLEILTTPQWFIKTVIHKDELIRRASEVNWYPEYMKTRLDNWINSIAWDWCISRQRYFGIPFPVWYSKRKNEEGKILFADISQLPVDPLQDLPIGYSREEVEPDLDVMDTWATSSISPQLSSRGISKDFTIDNNRHQKLFPADLRPQAHEIIRTWAFYTLLKAHLHQDTIPWRNIMISGWCRAEDKSKMSKSKGNVVEPEKLFAQYGVDVVRYWASSAKLGSDIVYCDNIMNDGKRLVNKLFNASKFVSIHFDILDTNDKIAELADIEHKITHNFDRFLMANIAGLVQKVESEMLAYEYATARHMIERFFWSVFCDNYLEITKIRAYNQNALDDKGQYSAVLTLYHSLKILLKLFAPFMPYITEEIYQKLYDSQSIHSRGNWCFIKPNIFTIDQIQPQCLIAVLEAVRKDKADKKLSVKAPIKLLELITDGLSFAPDSLEDLKNVTAAEEIKFVTEISANRERLEAGNIIISINYVN